MNTEDESFDERREMMKIIKLLSEAVLAQRQTLLPGVAAVPKFNSRSYPQKKEWRTWRGFCLEMQKLANEQRGLPGQRNRPVYKYQVANRGSFAERTIRRTMRGYGLDPDRDWPPFDWDPDQDREWHNPDSKT
jgi:hypothetical protein